MSDIGKNIKVQVEHQYGDEANGLLNMDCTPPKSASIFILGIRQENNRWYKNLYNFIPILEF